MQFCGDGPSGTRDHNTAVLQQTPTHSAVSLRSHVPRQCFAQSLRLTEAKNVRSVPPPTDDRAVHLDSAGS